MREALSTRVSAEVSADCTVHLTRTLDEAYYPGLNASDLDIKNNDQAISSYDLEAKPIILVPQLWLWRTGNNIVSACSILQESSVFEKYISDVDGRSPEWYNLLKESNLDLQLGLIIAGYVQNFGKGTTIGDIKFPPILSMFETCLISVQSKMTQYMKDRRTTSINYSSERFFIHKLADIQNELAIMSDVFDQQEEILDVVLKARPKAEDTAKKLKGFFEDELGKKHNRKEMIEIMEGTPDGWDEVGRARSSIAKYRRRVEKMDRDAQRIDKEVQDMLNLKRANASVRDAHASVIISTAVIGFTTVTIIFAPLAFLTALFALKIEGFERLRIDPTSDVYKSAHLGGIFRESIPSLFRKKRSCRKE